MTLSKAETQAKMSKLLGHIPGTWTESTPLLDGDLITVDGKPAIFREHAKQFGYFKVELNGKTIRVHCRSVERQSPGMQHLRKIFGK